MQIALSTLYRDAHPKSPATLIERLQALGASQVALDATLPDALGEALLEGARRSGTRVVVVEHEGLARLCADERDERAAALHNAQRAVERAGAAEGAVCVLALGAVRARRQDEIHREVARLFERAEWDPEAGWGGELLAERARLAPRHLDGARFCLESLLGLAEREQVRLALLPRPWPAALPDLGELEQLLRDFAGAPLGYFHDSAAAHREQMLELGRPGDWLAALTACTLGARLQDACGVRTGLAPGTGEIDFAPLGGVGLVVVAVPGIVPEREVKEGMRVVEGIGRNKE